MSEQRMELDDPYSFKDADIPQLLRVIRQFIVDSNADIQMIVCFPEASGWLTPPICRGGAIIKIKFSAPIEQEETLTYLIAEMKKQSA